MIDIRPLAIDKNNVMNISKFAQFYEIVPNSLGPNDAIGKPLVHISAVQQTTGSLQ